MCTKRKGFTFKAIMLALLSLFIFGCGGGGGTPTPALRPVNGVVSDSTGGQPFANAAVTAYAIDAAGNVSTVPLSTTVKSDGQGNFTLNIPAWYTGGIKLVATETTGTGTKVINSVLPSVSPGQVAVISPATDLVYQYIVTNKGGSFTPDNIQKAILVLEPFLGPNFTQTPPPAIGTTPTPAQQQLIVMNQAINSLTTPTTTIADLLTVNPATGVIRMGEGAVLTALNAAVTASSVTLINAGTVPGTFIPPVIIPVTEPTLTDTNPPTAPQNLTATSTETSVTLSWGAATDNVGVSSYYVYRNGVFITLVAATLTGYTDATVNSGTPYTYEVKARDASGNVSAAASVNISTLQILTYTISGRIATSNGSGLPSVFVAVSGAGAGVVVTDADGKYTFTGVRAGNYTITPTLSGFAFTPVSRPVDITTANVTGIDFAAAPVAPGTVTGETTYPDGTVVTTTTYPDGTVTVTTKYPNGTVSVSTTYPNGTVTTTTTYPDGTVTASITYPDGTVTTTTTYPNGAVTTTTTYPNGTVTTSTTYPNGTVTTSITYPNGTVTASTTYPDGTVVGDSAYPAGTATVLYTYEPATNVLVTGRVVDNNGNGLVGVPVVVTGAGSTTTGILGFYSISVAVGGTYTITPPAAPYVLNTVTYNTITFTPHNPNGSADAIGTTTITPSSNLSGRDFTFTP